MVPGLHEHPRGVQDPTVAVELVLPGCAIAHPHRQALGVAGPAAQIALGRHVAAIQGEQCRQPRSLQAARMKQPAEKPARLVELADPQERRDADAGIAGPRIAVVPVAHPAGILRQRRGRRGDGRPRGRVGQEPQRQQAAHRGVPVGEAVVDLRAPGLPAGLVLDDQLPGSGGVDVDERFAVCGQERPS